MASLVLVVCWASETLADDNSLPLPVRLASGREEVFDDISHSYADQVAVLRKILKIPRSKVQCLTIRTLVRLNAIETIPDLLDLLRSPPAYVPHEGNGTAEINMAKSLRQAVLDGLVQFGHPAADAILEELACPRAMTDEYSARFKANVHLLEPPVTEAVYRQLLVPVLVKIEGRDLAQILVKYLIQKERTKTPEGEENRRLTNLEKALKLIEGGEKEK